MKLHELLQVLVDRGEPITAKDMDDISKAVDTVKASTANKLKVEFEAQISEKEKEVADMETKLKADFEAKFQEIETKNKELSETLTPYLEKEKTESAITLLKDKVVAGAEMDAYSFIQDRLKFEADASDEDKAKITEEAITELFDSRPYLKPVDPGERQEAYIPKRVEPETQPTPRVNRVGYK